MRLSIFAYHIACLATCEGELTLHPCEGVEAKISIFPNPQYEGDKKWDNVMINGVHHGNRQGGIQEYTQMVVAAAPEVVLD